MPYIKPARRQEILRFNDVRTPGELNYIVTLMVHTYIQDHSLCYASLNEVIGVLECAKLELYRQIAAPYEDKKKNENSSVSELDK